MIRGSPQQLCLGTLSGEPFYHSDSHPLCQVLMGTRRERAPRNASQGDCRDQEWPVGEALGREQQG